MKRTLGFVTFVAMVCAPSAFFGSYYGAQALHTASAQTAPLGNGGPSVGCADTTLNCTGGYNVAVNQANAFTWTNFQNNTFVPTTPCQTSGPISPYCIGSPTSAIALAIGHATNAWGVGTNDNSGQIQWYYGAGGTEQHCGLWIQYGNGALQETGSRACGFQVNGNLLMNTYNVTGIGRLTQNAVGDMWNSCAMSASTSCTVTWTFTPTYCHATPLGSTAYYAAVSISGTTETVTANASNSATWDVRCD